MGDGFTSRKRFGEPSVPHSSLREGLGPLRFVRTFPAWYNVNMIPESSRMLSILPFLLLLPGCFSCFGPVDIEDFDTELEAWRLEAMRPGFDCSVRVAGECKRGRVLFLFEFGIDSGRILFFDADSRQFLGKRDFGVFCSSSSLVALLCPEGIATEAFCGSYEVGDAVPLR